MGDVTDGVKVGIGVTRLLRNGRDNLCNLLQGRDKVCAAGGLVKAVNCRARCFIRHVIRCFRQVVFAIKQCRGGQTRCCNRAVLVRRRRRARHVCAAVS